jgi:Cu(I)/Ag(I) efflux system periplasmic protein CusF
MRKLLLVLPLTLALGAPAHAAERPVVNGVVQKVDGAAGKITLKHDAVPNLKMGAMTMEWTVKEAAMLSGLKAGDKVKFEAESVKGMPKIVDIKKSK